MSKNYEEKNFEITFSSQGIFIREHDINNFTNKLSESLNNFELISAKNNKIIDDEIKSLIKWKEDIHKNIEMINDKTISEIILSTH